MRHILLLIAAVLTVATAAGAKKTSAPDPRADLRYRISQPYATSRDVPLDERESAGNPALSAAAETTFLADFTFDAFGTCVDESWTSVDMTEGEPNMWHVDDFAGLSIPEWQITLRALEGGQSLWCGARPAPGDPELCQYAALPGYGNSWVQPFCTKECLTVDAGVSISYQAAWDSEPGYDMTFVDVGDCDNQSWTHLIDFYEYDGTDSTTTTLPVPDSLHSGQLRLRFLFVSDGAWSDEDGLWDTGGAFILDSVSVSDAGGIVLPLETFEDEPVGATEADDWAFCRGEPYGDFAALFPAITLVQEDPCVSNLSCVWGFFNGSTADYSCGGFPSQTAVPYGKTLNEYGFEDIGYIMNEIWSPLIPWTGSGNTAVLEFDVYRDLPLDAGVFYRWRVRSYVGGCPTEWEDRNLVVWGEEKAWVRERVEFGDLVVPGATGIQVTLACMDMCRFWCGIYFTGDCHSHSPLFDNVKVYRVETEGPQWSVDDINLFQDSFAEDGTTTGTVRADAARNTASPPSVVPQDNIRMTVADPEAGLAGDPHTGFGPAVYAYVSVWPQGQPGKTGGAISDSGRWPVVDSLDHDGARWYCVRMDTVFSSPGRAGPVDDRFCVDLNDNLFTPGDTVCFFFCATSDTPSTVSTYWSEFTGTTTDLNEALDNPMEFTCLPGAGWLRGGDILYVDGADGLGAQPYIEQALGFPAGILDEVDRFDIRGPTSNQGNRPGYHVKNVSQQLLDCYRFIIWSTGTVPDGTVGDGTGSPEGADDASMLLAFLDGLDSPGGIYFTGDDLAGELSALTGAGAVGLRSKYISYGVSSSSHIQWGLGVSPLVVGVSDGCFHHVGSGADQFTAYGGCPILRKFDVLVPTGTATLEAFYSAGGTAGGAIVAQRSLNPDSTSVGVLLSGFGFDAIRDDEPTGVPDRWHHMFDILTWLGKSLPIPVAAGDTPARNHLAPNYPNPFNPTTTIEFEVRERTMVRLSVYNIRGQKVRALVREVREPNVLHRVTWDGRNDAGERVASGVYFYKLATDRFTQTRKLVLLK